MSELGNRPDAPFRLLLGMMALKEGNGCSDEQMFGNCRFDLRCMRSPGLHHIGDGVPVASTCYEFRMRLFSDHRPDGESFQGVCRSQVWPDSRLLRSNIAGSGRPRLNPEAIGRSTAHLDIGGPGTGPIS